MTGEIIEHYPDSYPYPACLVFGINVSDQNLHVIVGCNEEYLKIITAYYPLSEKFEDNGKVRKEIK